MNSDAWVALAAIAAVVVSAGTLLWSIVDRQLDRRHRAEEERRAAAEKHKQQQMDVNRRHRREFADLFVAWVIVMRDALRAPHLRQAAQQEPDRILRLYGHAPKEAWMLTAEPGSELLIRAGERFYSKWQHEDLTLNGANFKMIRDAEQLMSALGRWVETGQLPKRFDEPEPK